MEDEEFIQHSSHEHPLKRIPNVTEEVGWRRWCYGCWRYFLPEEAAYGCSAKCGMNWCFHQECAEMAREIWHPVHPSHPLTLADLQTTDTKCAVCEREYGRLGYVCSRGCKLWIHLGCTRGLPIAVADEQVMKHPSHPQHELRFLRRKKRSCSFECDACGTIEEGNSYICSICQYWIHERCSSLPTTARFHHHPDHSLSLVFYLPSVYIEYDYTCGICNGALRLRNWVYHCELCRYVVHINCATNTPPVATSSL